MTHLIEASIRDADVDGATLLPASPCWLIEPRRVVSTMLQQGLVMFRPVGGPYLLSDEKQALTPVFVSDTAVDVLLERGWLTRIEGDARRDTLFLLTAEGRRTGAAFRPAAQ